MNLIIVEDNQMLRQNLAFLLGNEFDIQVSASFESAEECLKNFDTLKCDVMLIDIDLPGISGIELVYEIMKLKPETDILMHTVFDDRDSVFAAIRAGASGYILKGSTPKEIIDAIHNLYNGGAPMSMYIARSVIREFQDQYNEKNPLSLRETEILNLLVKGLTYKEIGESLSLSTHTVHTHIKNIYSKLHANTRSEAIFKARKKGIL